MRMHHAGVQFTGVPWRRDECQDQRVAHLQGARERRERDARIGEVLRSPEAATSLGIHIVHAQGHLLARMLSGIGGHAENSSVVSLVVVCVRCVAEMALCAYRQGGPRS